MRKGRGLTIRNMYSVEKCRTYGARLLFAPNPALPGWAEVWSRPYGPPGCRTPNRTRKDLPEAKNLTWTGIIFFRPCGTVLVWACEVGHLGNGPSCASL